MRKFLITNPKYTGAAEVIYNDNATLCLVDLTKTDMSGHTVDHFLHSIPSSMITLINGTRFSKETTIVDGDLDVNFELFYKDYPLKRNRYKVEQVWNTLSKEDQVKAFYSLHSYKKYITKNPWYNAMIGDKYLRNKEYLTEWNKL